MAIFRTKKISNFTMVDNILIDDKDLTIEEKGLMLILLRLPENWDFSAKGLSVLTGKNKDTTNKILRSLENKNYLHRTKFFKDGKIAGTCYYIFETRQIGIEFKQDIEKQDIEKQDIEKQDIENQYNKQDIYKTSTNNNKDYKKEKYKKEKIETKRLYFTNENVNEIFIEFLQLREKLKAINSEQAINRLINKLNKYDDATKIEMIENSIINSWKGVFELKGGYKQKEDSAILQILKEDYKNYE